MTPSGEKYNRTPAEWDQAEPDWDQEAHEADLAAARKRENEHQSQIKTAAK